MDFKKFTDDSKIAIQKLETYGLSCLIKTCPNDTISIKKSLETIPNEIHIFSEPKSFRESGALGALSYSEINPEWTFELRKIHPDNQIINASDILMGFIMLPSHKNISGKKINIEASFYIYETCISVFKFEPFVFIPAIEHTYFINICSGNHYPNIKFNKTVEFDIYFLTAYLDTRNRQYVCQKSITNRLFTPVDQFIYVVYDRGLCAVCDGIDQDSLNTMDNSKNPDDYNLKINLPKSKYPSLPFDKNEFIEYTYNPNRVYDWCLDIDQQLTWK